MGLTPIEEPSDAGDETPSEQDTRGVRQRLRQAVSRLVKSVLGGIGGLFSSDGDGAGETARGGGGRRARRGDVLGTEHRETAIRQTGQARLESGPDGQLPEYRRDEQPAHERDIQVEARIRGETMRVYDPDRRDAYIVSDVYERIER